MPRQIFVNLPVKDVVRSRAFWSALGFGFNEQFCNDNAICVVIAEGRSYAMLLHEPFFQSFTKKPLADATRSTEVLIALDCDSRAEVDEMVRKAVAAGGTAPNDRKDHGFMVQHGFDDPDGHSWEVFWMDMAAMPPAA